MVEFVNQPHENPILEQLSANLKGYVETAIRLRDQEVPFRAINTNQEIAKQAARRSISHLIAASATNITAIGMDAAATRTWFMVDRSFQSLSERY